MLLALLVEAVLLRRLVGSSPTTMVLATLGVSLMIHPVVLMIWGVGTHGSVGPVGLGHRQRRLGGAPAEQHRDAWSPSVIALAALGFFFRRTPYGLAMRATASHIEAALAQGINVRRMFALAWAVAAVLAVVASVFLASFPRVVSPTIGLVALAAIPAIVIGGMDSLVGAVVGGLIVGLIQVLGAGYLADYGGGKLHEVLPYLLMLVVLVFRPYGLFGSRSIERV